MPPRLDPITVVITEDGMGNTDRELAHKLVQTYLNLLDLDDRLPTAICLYAEGVKLAVDGSPVLEELASLAAKGVDLIACGTCLNYFDLADRVRVGRIGSMKDIVAAQWDAAKVVTL
jgi:selenium metabolism protein YedF